MDEHNTTTYSILTPPGTAATDDGDDFIGIRSGIPAYIECIGKVLGWIYVYCDM